MRLTIALLAAVALFSCRSPQRLIEKAIKKDPKVLNEYTEGDTVFVYTDSVDTVVKETLRYISKEPSFAEKFLNHRQIIKDKKLEARNERQEKRQDEKTERKSLVQENRTERKDIKQSEKSQRTKTRKEEQTKRQHKRQDGKTDRSGGWWMFFVLLAFILGMVTSRVMTARMDWRNKVDR